jgi:hypothetical protein
MVKQHKYTIKPWTSSHIVLARLAIISYEIKIDACYRNPLVNRSPVDGSCVISDELIPVL